MYAALDVSENNTTPMNCIKFPMRKIGYDRIKAVGFQGRKNIRLTERISLDVADRPRCDVVLAVLVFLSSVSNYDCVHDVQ